MGNSAPVTLSAVHEGYLIALIVICVLQFLFYLSRLSVLRNEAAKSKREQISLQQELTRLQKDREAMEFEANYDTLTGLPNRRSFEQKLQTVLDDVRSQQSQCSLMMIDFDHFKSINDSFGHQAGDEVLKSLAVQLQPPPLQRECPEEALCARYGGDEFSAILPGAGVEQSGRFAETLRTRIEALELEFKGIRCPLTISIGVATFPAETQEPKSLLELADQSLYRAKTQGRNRVCRPSGQAGNEPTC